MLNKQRQGMEELKELLSETPRHEAERLDGEIQYREQILRGTLDEARRIVSKTALTKEASKAQQTALSADWRAAFPELADFCP